MISPADPYTVSANPCISGRIYFLLYAGFPMLTDPNASHQLLNLITRVFHRPMQWNTEPSIRVNFFVATISLLNSDFQLTVSADNVLSQIFTQTLLPEIIKRFIIIPVPVFRSFQHSPNRCRHYIIKFFKLQEGIFR